MTFIALISDFSAVWLKNLLQFYAIWIELAKLYIEMEPRHAASSAKLISLLNALQLLPFGPQIIAPENNTDGLNHL